VSAEDVVSSDDRHWENRQTRSKRQKKSAALKGAHRPLARAALFGKNDHRVSFSNPVDGHFERLHRCAAILPVDGNEPRPPDGPPEDRDLEQAHLGHEADGLRNRREDAGDIEVAVVVGDQDVPLLPIDALGSFRAKVDPRPPHNGPGPHSDDAVDDASVGAEGGHSQSHQGERDSRRDGDEAGPESAEHRRIISPES